MSILVNNDTRVIVQGITGRDGGFHAKAMLDYGTKVVAGVTPGKGGQKVDEIPVFNSVTEAKKATDANTSIIFVPAAFAADAIYEAIDAKLDLVVCVSEGVPTLAMIKLMDYLKDKKTRLIGPNSPGLISPGEAKVGILPGATFCAARSGTISFALCSA